MKNLLKRANHVLNGEDGASNVEIIVWFSVVFVVATVLFAFREQVTTFIGTIGTRVQNLQSQ